MSLFVDLAYISFFFDQKIKRILDKFIKYHVSRGKKRNMKQKIYPLIFKRVKQSSIVGKNGNFLKRKFIF